MPIPFLSSRGGFSPRGICFLCAPSSPARKPSADWRTERCRDDAALKRGSTSGGSPLPRVLACFRDATDDLGKPHSTRPSPPSQRGHLSMCRGRSSLCRTRPQRRPPFKDASPSFGRIGSSYVVSRPGDQSDCRRALDTSCLG